MNTFSGSLWLRLYSALVSHAARLEARPRLAPLVSDFAGVVALLKAALAIPEGQDAELDALRLAARTWDHEHDDGQRSFLRLLQAFAFRGTPEQRAAIEAALDVLYPNGLGVVNLSYAEEVGATQVLAELRKSAVATSAVAILAAEVPAAGSWIDRIVNAGQELGKAIDAVDERLAVIAGTKTGGGAQYVNALNTCRRTWSYFLTTLNFDLKAGTAEDDELRELLVGPYLRELDRVKLKPKPEPQATPVA